MPPKKAGKDFQWTDDEAELLLTVTYDYKVKKVALLTAVIRKTLTKCVDTKPLHNAGCVNIKNHNK